MRAGLLGRKLGHSLSPQIHRFFGDYEYKLYEREPDDVESFVRSCGLDLLNVTIPYKQTVFAICDELSPMARRLGNVNLVTRDSSGHLYGDNTDAYGVERLLDSVGADVHGRPCAVLGAGGAAMTAKAVLEERGASSVALVRRGELPAQDDYLIVNATPVGMFPDVDGVRVNIADFPNCRYVIDLVYNPSPTRLVREAQECGKVAVDGLVMLIAQAYRAYVLAAAPSSSARESATLYLYGPPASGKSTLSKKIAAATGWNLVDLDAEIVRVEGRSIPDIFAAEGEAGFRAIEKRELKRVSETRGQVVALGGGALLNDECRAIAESSGRVLLLDCSMDTLKSRITGKGDRPLSADTARLEALVNSRKAHYDSFPNHIRMV